MDFGRELLALCVRMLSGMACSGGSTTTQVRTH
jgi:hypothetical protein